MRRSSLESRRALLGTPSLSVVLSHSPMVTGLHGQYSNHRGMRGESGLMLEPLEPA